MKIKKEGKQRAKIVKSIKRLFSILFVFTISTKFGLAQPGYGGGGLRIKHFFDEDLKKVELSDANLHFRAFKLKDTLAHSVVHQEFYVVNPQQIDQFNLRYIINPYYSDWNSFRYYIIRKMDTMIIDYHGISSANYNGASDYMDSLVFRKGYSRYFRNPRHGKFKNKENDLVQKMLNNGFTPHTIKKLGKLGFITTHENTSSNLRIDKYLPSFYIYRARFTMQENPEKALKDLRKARSLKLTDEEKQHLLYTEYLFFKYQKNLPKALQAISKLAKIMAKPKYNDTYWENYLAIDNFKRKIELRKQLNSEDNLIRDYNTIVRIATYGIKCASDSKEFGRQYRARHISAKKERTNYLHEINDYSEEISIYTNRIKQQPFDQFNRNPEIRLVFGEEYFQLGKAEFLMGKEKAAFRNWFIFADHGGSKNEFEKVLPFMDSLVATNPEKLKVRLIRGAMNLQAGNFVHKPESRKYFLQALNDFESIKDNKLNDFKMDYYRAKTLYNLGRYDEARKLVNLSIEKNKKHALSYLLRYHIYISSNNLENNLFRFKSKDYQEYERLKMDWVFPK